MELRVIVDDLERVKSVVESLGGKFRNYYSFKDIIFVQNKRNYNLNEDFLRVRVIYKGSWPSKPIVLTRKKTSWKDVGKVSNKVIDKQFDSEKEAFDFIKNHFGSNFVRGFDYSRKGWRYIFGKSEIFIEDIEGQDPTVEVESKNKVEMDFLLDKIGVIKVIRDSVPELIRKKLN